MFNRLISVDMPTNNTEYLNDNAYAARKASAVADVERPLLETFAPDIPDTGSWTDKLHWLVYRYGFSVTMLVEAGLGSKSTIHAYLQGVRGANVPEDKLRDMATRFGFPMEAWWWTLVDFDDYIRERYPQYTGVTPMPSSGEDDEGYSNGYIAEVFDLAA